MALKEVIIKEIEIEGTSYFVGQKFKYKDSIHYVSKFIVLSQTAIQVIGDDNIKYPFYQLDFNF